MLHASDHILQKNSFVQFTKVLDLMMREVWIGQKESQLIGLAFVWSYLVVLGLINRFFVVFSA